MVTVVNDVNYPIYSGDFKDGKSALEDGVARRVCFTDAFLEEADLASAMLKTGEFEYCSFVKCNLQNASFERAKLINCDLTSANCHMTDFTMCDLSYSNFNNANLTEANFLYACVFGCSFNKAKLNWEYGNLLGEILRSCLYYNNLEQRKLAALFSVCKSVEVCEMIAKLKGDSLAPWVAKVFKQYVDDDTPDYIKDFVERSLSE